MNIPSSVLVFFVLTLLTIVIQAQDYAEYARGAAMQRRRNPRGMIFMGGAGVVLGGLISGWHTSRTMKRRNEKEKKELLQYIQLQDEIYKHRDQQWQAEYNKLYKAYQELETESIERDYEEFKAPDTNNDDMISRSEFNTYVRKYLSSFPELSEKDFPKFEEFDLDGDGVVSFDEWQRFLALQKKEEAKKAKGGDTKGQTSAYQELLNALYEQSYQSDSFNSLQKNMGGKSTGAVRRG
eukprot:gene13834-18555_t